MVTTIGCILVILLGALLVLLAAATLDIFGGYPPQR